MISLEQALKEALPQQQCACGCGLSVDHKRGGAKYYDDTHRQRGNRGSAAHDPYFELSGVEREWLQERVSRCRCNGHHLLDGDDGNCIKCGVPYRDGIAPYYLRVWGRATDRRSLIRCHLADLAANA
jgi:hypothetical protein